MSSDTGIYILKTPARPVKIILENGDHYYENRHEVFEFRVAPCANIENIDRSELWLPAIFGDSEVYLDEKSAFSKADLIKKECEYLTEYGICIVEKSCIFPNMTHLEAYKALDSYVEIEE